MACLIGMECRPAWVLAAALSVFCLVTRAAARPA